MWLLVVSGALIGAINGLAGAGASFLTVLLLVHVGGLELGSAVATTLVVVGVMSMVGLVPYAVEGAVRWRAALGIGVPSMVGAAIGGGVATAIPQRALLFVFLLAMIVAAVGMLWPREAPPSCVPPNRMQRLTLATTGLVVGGLGGMVGLGGGFAVVPLLTLSGGASVRSAVGTSLLVVVMTKLAGILGHLPHGNLAVNWHLAASLALAESGGAVAASRLGRSVSGRTIRTVFASVMFVVAAYLLGSALLRAPA